MTKVKPKNLMTPLTKADLKLTGYELLPNRQCFTNEGRGVSVYIQENMVRSCKEVTLDVCAESIWVNINNIDGTVTKFGCLYRSPNSSELTNRMLNEFIKSIESGQSDLILIEYFNYPDVDWPNSTCQKDEDHPARVFLESVRDGLLIQHIMESTRWREGQTPSTLDLLLTNKEGLVSDVVVHAPLGKGDHGIIIFKMHCGNTKEDKTS